MTLDRSKWIVRYYLWLVFTFNDQDAVERRLERGTNLCFFVQRIIFGTAILGFGVFVGCWFFYHLIRLATTSPTELLFGLAFIAAIFGLVFILFGLLWGVCRLSKSESIPIAYIKAIKRGVCPLIKFGQNEKR